MVCSNPRGRASQTALPIIERLGSISAPDRASGLNGGIRALTRDEYGPVENLAVREVPEPEIRSHQILIRVRAASLNRSDWEALVARPGYVRMSGVGLRRPRSPLLGTDLAGVVEAVGSDVTGFREGDEVFGDIMYHGGRGAFAEYVAVPESAPLAIKPGDLSFEEAAALPQAGSLAVRGLQGVGEGDRILINGAGGGAGTFAIQIAKAHGAHVTAVDNAHKQDLMLGLGADRVIDYTRERYSRRHGPFDLILAFMAGRGVLSNRRGLARHGRYLLVGGTVRELFAVAAIGRGLLRLGSRHLGVLVARPNREDLRTLADRVVAGEMSPVISGRYSLEEAPEAYRRLGQGTLLGKAVITLG